MYKDGTLRNLLEEFIHEPCGYDGSKEAISDLIEAALKFYIEKHVYGIGEKPEKIADKQICLDDEFTYVTDFLNLFNENCFPIFGDNFIRKKAKSIYSFDKQLYDKIFNTKSSYYNNNSNNSSNSDKCNGYLMFKPVSFINYVLSSKRTTQQMRKQINKYIESGVVCLKN